jgi:CubicO group peptidase (beta-lactamase class C family)
MRPNPKPEAEMKRRRFFCPSLFVLWVACLSVSGLLSQQKDLAAKLKKIEAYAEKARAEWSVPGCALSVVKDDAVVLEKGFGGRELGKPAPVDRDTLFAIGSCSKAFTAAALAILVDEGKIKWNDPVINYLPGFEMYDPWVTREMQVRDLLSHRSGLATFGGDLTWYWTKYDRREILRRVRYLKPTSSFRTQFGYQNIMFVAAGEIIPAVTGKTWDEFVKERLFLPLGMTTTITTHRDIRPDGNVAIPHNEYQGKLRVIQHYENDNMAAAGGIITSVHEMAQWIRLQLGRGTFQGQKIFSPAASRAMWSPHTFLPVAPQAEERQPATHFQAYGLGWRLNDYAGRKVVSHGGGIDGMTSQIMLVPEERLGVMVVTNSETPASGAIARQAVDIFLGAPERDWSAELLKSREEGRKASEEAEKKIEAERAKGTAPSLPLEAYAGTYASDLYGETALSVEGGRLVMTFHPTKNLIGDLDHWHFDTFRISIRPMNYPFGKGFVTFRLNSKGKVESLEVDIPNPDFNFKELDLRKVQK